MILVGAGQIGMAIARRMGYGMAILVADKNPDHAADIAQTMTNAGFDARPETVDLASRESITKLIDMATSLGDVTMLVNAAGVSPAKRPSRRFSTWTCTARPYCSRRSARSSPPEVWA